MENSIVHLQKKKKMPYQRLCKMMMSWMRLGLPLALLCLCSPSASGHHSDHLCMRRTFWQQLMRGLENINPVFSPECRSEYDASLAVPRIARPAENDKAALVVEVLTRIQGLFSGTDVILDNRHLLMFLNKISEILSQLQSCIKSPPALISHQSAAGERFQVLKTFLRQKRNSGCAWEIVHAVVREILQEAAINHARK
ncbi:interferon alpha-1 [Scyliorhinus torazame]|uniref:interferon alpha-1 n=1 Tax=Scyliorhinus torazame TaxID=75743 RepID=UPI003B5BAEAD